MLRFIYPHESVINQETEGVLEVRHFLLVFIYCGI